MLILIVAFQSGQCVRSDDYQFKHQYIITTTHLVDHTTQESRSLLWGQFVKRAGEDKLGHHQLIAGVDFTRDATLGQDNPVRATVPKSSQHALPSSHLNGTMGSGNTLHNRHHRETALCWRITPIMFSTLTPADELQNSTIAHAVHRQFARFAHESSSA